MNTTEQYVPININLTYRVRIFMLYLGQQFTDTDYNIRPFTSLGLKDGWQIIAHDPEIPHDKPNDYTHNIKNCTLLLTSLSLITDEDAIQVAKMAGMNRGDVGDDEYAKFGKEVIKGWLNHKIGILGEEWLEIIDFLRLKGYALPYLSWSVDELVSFGVYRLKQ